MRAHTSASAPHAHEQPLNRFDLGAGGPSPAPRQPVRAAAPLSSAQPFHRLVALGVDADDRVQTRRGLEPDREDAVGHALKVVDAAVTHERFEADDAPLVEDLEVVEVVGNEAAPQAEIDEGFLRRDRELLIKGCGSRRRGMGVEGHLEHGRHAPGGRTARTGLPTFPIVTARLIEVDVRVDDTRKHHQISRVDGFVTIPHFTPDCRDGAVEDRDVGWALPGGKNDRTTPNDESAHRTSSMVISCAPSHSVRRPISGRFSCPSVTVAK